MLLASLSAFKSRGQGLPSSKWDPQSLPCPTGLQPGYTLGSTGQLLKKLLMGLPSWSSDKTQCFQCRGCKFDPWSGN